jgi:hypothetical protein
MELDIDQLAAGGVVLGFERPFGRHRVVVGPSGGVSGQIASDSEGTYVEARTAEMLALREVVWALRHGEVRVLAELDLRGVEVELSIPRNAATIGRVAVEKAHSDDVRLAHASLGGAEITAEDAALDGVSIAIGDEATTIAIEEARFGRLTVPIADRRLALDGLVMRKIEVTVPKAGGWQVRFGHLESRTFALPLGETQLEIEALALHEGATVGASGLLASVVEAGAMRLSVTGLDARKPPSEPPRAVRPPLDLGFLDRLAGRIHLDLLTDMRLPIIRTRRATHTIRLEVRDGMIQYKHLEKGLAPLEDAVLDFAIRKGRLVLEKDIPLIPFDRRTLVSWPLEGDERRLAENGWVRLARLARPRVEVETKPPKKPKTNGDSMVREIRAEAIDIAVRLDAHPELVLPSGAKLRLGHDGAGAFQRLMLRGRVVYRPDGDHETQALDAEGNQIALGIDEVPFGSRHATVRTIVIERLASLRLHLDGVRPTALEGHLEGIALRNVIVQSKTADA